jgi:hypothetical protein
MFVLAHLASWQAWVGANQPRRQQCGASYGLYNHQHIFSDLALQSMDDPEGLNHPHVLFRCPAAAQTCMSAFACTSLAALTVSQITKSTAHNRRCYTRKIFSNGLLRLEKAKHILAILHASNMSRDHVCICTFRLMASLGSANQPRRQQCGASYGLYNHQHIFSDLALQSMDDPEGLNHPHVLFRCPAAAQTCMSAFACTSLAVSPCHKSQKVRPTTGAATHERYSATVCCGWKRQNIS